MTPSEIGRLIEPLKRRVMLVVGRATVRRAEAGGGLQRLQASLLPGEMREGIEHLQPYGFTSRPRPGAEALVLSVGGERGHPVCVVADDPRRRPADLAEGEVCLYGPADGQRVVLRANGDVEVTGGLIRFVPTSRLRVEGDVEVTGDVVAGGISLRTHRHGGVATGGGISGVPQ